MFVRAAGNARQSFAQIRHGRMEFRRKFIFTVNFHQPTALVGVSFYLFADYPFNGTILK